MYEKQYLLNKVWNEISAEIVRQAIEEKQF